MAATSRTLARTLPFLSALLALAWLAPASLRAQRIAVDSVTLAVQPDSSCRVIEHIVYDFGDGSFSYLMREVPLARTRAVELISLTSPAMRIRGATVNRTADGRAQIRAYFRPSHGQVPFVLTYEARGALERDGVRSLVQWDPMSPDSSQAPGTLQLTVLLPAAFHLDSTRILLQPRGLLARASDGGWRAEFVAGGASPRPPSKLTVAFSRVPIAAPPPAPRAVAPTRQLPSGSWWMIPLALLAGLLPGVTLFRLWRGPTREVMPAGVAPAPLTRAAAMLPEWTGGPARMFAAVLLELAARGHVELQRMVRKKHTVMCLTVHDEVPDPLTDFERAFLDEVRRHPTLDRFRRRGRRYRRRALRGVRRELIAEGLLELHARRSALLLLGVVAASALGVVIVRTGGSGLLPLGLFLLALGAGLVLAALRVRNVTQRGAFLRAQVQEYLGAVRRRIERLSDRSPTQAAEAYVENLPWLTLDTEIDRHWVAHIMRGFGGVPTDLRASAWTQDAVALGDLRSTYAAMAVQGAEREGAMIHAAGGAGDGFPAADAEGAAFPAAGGDGAPFPAAGGEEPEDRSPGHD